MATFIELKRDYGWKYALKEAWDCAKWHKLNLIGLLRDLFIED